MGREVGGGIGMGKTCQPKAFSFQCMTKFTTNKNKNKTYVSFHRWINWSSYVLGNFPEDIRLQNIRFMTWTSVL